MARISPLLSSSQHVGIDLVVRGSIEFGEHCLLAVGIGAIHTRGGYGPDVQSTFIRSRPLGRKPVAGTYAGKASVTSESYVEKRIGKRHVIAAKLLQMPYRSFERFGISGTEPAGAAPRSRRHGSPVPPGRLQYSFSSLLFNFTSVQQGMCNCQFIDILQFVAETYTSGYCRNLHVEEAAQPVLDVEKRCLALDRGRYGQYHLAYAAPSHIGRQACRSSGPKGLFPAWAISPRRGHGTGPCTGAYSRSTSDRRPARRHRRSNGRATGSEHMGQTSSSERLLQCEQ